MLWPTMSSTEFLALSANRPLCQALTPTMAAPVTATLATASATTFVLIPQRTTAPWPASPGGSTPASPQLIGSRVHDRYGWREICESGVPRLEAVLPDPAIGPVVGASCATSSGTTGPSGGARAHRHPDRWRRLPRTQRGDPGRRPLGHRPARWRGG